MKIFYKIWSLDPNLNQKIKLGFISTFSQFIRIRNTSRYLAHYTSFLDKQQGIRPTDSSYTLLTKEA